MILDEADQLLDMGFKDSIESIVEALPKERQTLFFSATVSKQIKAIARTSLKPDFTFIDTVDPNEANTNLKVWPNSARKAWYSGAPQGDGSTVSGVLPTSEECCQKRRTKFRRRCVEQALVTPRVSPIQTLADPGSHEGQALHTQHNEAW